MDQATELALKGLLGAAAVALLLLAQRLAPGRAQRLSAAIYAGLALAGLAAFYNFGSFRHHRDLGFVNQWEHFHYQLGAKYFPELGYDGLYVASLSAHRQSAPAPLVASRVRDLRTNRVVPARAVQPHLAEVVDRFRPERWQSFVADHAYYLEANDPDVMGDLRRDHGYNPTPAWTFVARLFAVHLGSSPSSLSLLASLDVILMGIAFATVFATYGARVGCLSLAIFGLGYGWRYNYIGAFLRLDWLAAALIGICMLKRQRHALAGALFGYATLVRVFPVLLLFGPALLAARAWLRGERPGWALRLAAGFTAVAAMGLLAGSLTGRGLRAWPEFVNNIELHRQTWAASRVGLDSLLLNGPALMVQGLAERALPPEWPVTYEDARRSRQERWALGALAKAALLVLLGAAAWRAPLDQSAVLGIVAVFALTPVGSYYWIVLAAVPLRRGAMGPVGVLALGAALHAAHLVYSGFELVSLRYALMAWGLALLLLVWIFPDALATLRGRPLPHRSSTASTPASAVSGSA